MDSTRVGNGRLGINGLGRIGKLALWYNVAAGGYDRIVVNVGREVGRSLDDLCHYLSHDSTYGSLASFLHGFGASNPVKIFDRDRFEIEVDGVRVSFLTAARNPRDIPWRDHEVRIVLECTGAFRDPTADASAARGSIRGHLEAGARVVVNSSAFKTGDITIAPPEDAVTLIYGINEEVFDPGRHCLISAASCTTTGLAHMLRPLMESPLTSRMLTAGMSTIHAATNTQAVLDQVPKSGAGDLRKTRSILNNIILTSTNAASALEKVIPEVRRIGFLADSVRVPTPTASLLILNCTFQSELDERGESTINREVINEIFRRVAPATDGGLRYTDRQNVSADMVGEMHAVVIEGHETHTRTGFIDVRLKRSPEQDQEEELLTFPVTHAKIFGWYDNELGSYTRRMSQLAAHLADRTT